MKLTKKNYPYNKQCISIIDIREAVKTLKSDFLTQGPKIAEFEKEICKYTNAKYAVAVSNGTAALHICMLALDIKNNDEVITTPITFVSSANCVLYVNARVKFADIDPRTALIDPNEIQKTITKNTKCIIPVHYAGQSCDMERIYNIARENDLFIVEDAAHAIGSSYKSAKVGSCQFSDLCVFSFHPIKNITTTEGGVITTNNKNLYDKLCLLRSCGITKDPKMIKNSEGPWYYEMQKLGYNYRLSDVGAALGISQLKKLSNFTNKRNDLVNYYRELFQNDERFNFLKDNYYGEITHHLFCLLINFDKLKITKKELVNELKKYNIFTQVHYIPVYKQPYYQQLGFKNEKYPNSEKYYQKTLSLPLYVQLNKKDVAFITSIIKKISK